MQNPLGESLEGDNYSRGLLMSLQRLLNKAKNMVPQGKNLADVGFWASKCDVFGKTTSSVPAKYV